MVKRKLHRAEVYCIPTLNFWPDLELNVKHSSSFGEMNFYA